MVIEEHKKTPYIKLSTDLFEIKGKSYSEGIRSIYREVLVWLDDNENDLNNLICNFHFNIIDSTSQKKVFEILMKLKEISDKTNIKINWYYDDDDEEIMELGEEFIELIEIPMIILPVEKY